MFAHTHTPHHTHTHTHHTPHHTRWMDSENKTMSDWTRYPMTSDLLASSSPSLPIKCSLLLKLSSLWSIVQWLALSELCIPIFASERADLVVSTGTFLYISLGRCTYRNVVRNSKYATTKFSTMRRTHAHAHSTPLCSLAIMLCIALVVYIQWNPTL